MHLNQVPTSSSAPGVSMSGLETRRWIFVMGDIKLLDALAEGADRHRLHGILHHMADVTWPLMRNNRPVMTRLNKVLGSVVSAPRRADFQGNDMEYQALVYHTNLENAKVSKEVALALHRMYHEVWWDTGLMSPRPVLFDEVAPEDLAAVEALRRRAELSVEAIIASGQDGEKAKA